MRYAVPLQENGRMILPIDIRRALNLKKGDKVIIETEGDRVELTTAQRERQRAKTMFRKFVPAGEPIVDEVIADRRDEALRDEAEFDTSAQNSSRGLKR
ncbi:AbrB/MazE/SpoVT family DNA-binding domain-containing protein [Aliihoeflea aestuarii]|uniref:AbrB/MazE/SpoVT family DNA-binding domain-containing protein n=1 Tax=Aliihoeflea aestuarii TaxID=453840 RepID=UPI002096310A|nr:AbrB/MazE/SpoVT family DNA-binding domain-containing protein [Aliihoeflea aestuarii]MCO6392581.1 AbrB/MazE/SpoVT family DNA-binding domain-containing protein [Aliihoeflea aestuarii]